MTPEGRKIHLETLLLDLQKEKKEREIALAPIAQIYSNMQNKLERIDHQLKEIEGALRWFESRQDDDDVPF